MSRVQIALNVPDIEQAVGFYSTLFATEPAKRKPGYANFAISDPPLKLVLFENDGEGQRLNHIGIEVDDSQSVRAHQDRLARGGIQSADGSGTCCYAHQDKVWVDGPDGAWEIYSVVRDSETFGITSNEVDADSPSSCCTPSARC